ncbi:hypothetical protein K490DRAFT_71450 [Saccharata proteae CBS 121410]|uniref:Uncharacterized protein n=1 Tax=Saccharata proteae CBS 121410 TaxID=1314787 RepID=A0A9P4I0F4_9PEZI|nr:hypothetical protein K490DRAFT_71450 [Saccharata proteae CBS 121410]
MHRKHPISVVVYNHLFPNPRPEDPTSFSAHLSKNLVGEVRIETATFYGSLDTVEARYPGLNYSHPPHRKRLGRFPHHARLFQAFDELQLTETEIAGLCRWEGTLWARERYERDEGCKVEDTTGNEIGPWVDHRRQRQRPRQGDHIRVKTDIANHRPDEEMPDSDASDDCSDSEELESIGIPLNQRLIEAAARREQGVSVVMDPDYEKFLERAQQRGEIHTPTPPPSPMPPIPSFLHHPGAQAPPSC